MQQQTRETGAECVMRRRRPAWPWTDATRPANESRRDALGTKIAAALALRSAGRSCLARPGQADGERRHRRRGIKTTRCWNVDKSIVLATFHDRCWARRGVEGPKGVLQGSAGQLAIRAARAPAQIRYPETSLLTMTSTATAS